jgi:hypothetical protein
LKKEKSEIESLKASEAQVFTFILPSIAAEQQKNSFNSPKMLLLFH